MVAVPTPRKTCIDRLEEYEEAKAREVCLLRNEKKQKAKKQKARPKGVDRLQRRRWPERSEQSR